ncbi:RDD family protein [Massilia sp. H6]|uniref:RDD family protein n=1 Tax=Massilia sp. H6 TaxID=2970464 RepID=UPI002167C443|nr:RDD family protein [Massilia sp. H6]UVW27355.1 RDD family protein [Massilia sp. H6]
MLVRDRCTALLPITQASAAPAWLHPGLPFELPLARAWQRWCARSFDIWWQTALVALAAGHAIASVAPAFLRWLETPLGWKLFGLACIPAGLLLDAALHAVAGSTPGKALLGLQVLGADGRTPRFGELAGRNLRLWYAGLGLGLPLLILLTMARQGLRLRGGRPASYDSGRFLVRASPVGCLRKSVFGVLFVLLLGTVVALDAADRQDSREIAAAQPAPQLAWTNPVTGLAVPIGAQWQADVRIVDNGNDSDSMHYLFTERGGRAVVLLAFDEHGKTSLPAYTRALMDRLGADLVLEHRRIDDFRGRPSWAASGAGRDGATTVRLRVVPVQGRAWRVMVMQAPPLAATDDLVHELSDALWESVLPI